MIGAQLEGASKGRALASGLLLLAIMATCVLLAARPAHAATFTVNSISDFGDATPDRACDSDRRPAVRRCALREAIQEANTTPAADRINFNIPGNGVKTISPRSSLPDITRPVIVDGYTQTGARANTAATGTNAVLRVELRGDYPQKFLAGLRMPGNNTTVRGLAINEFFTAIAILGSENQVRGNFVGAAPSGTQARGNANSIFIGEGASNNTIGGGTPAARNIVSGNQFGVSLSGSVTGTKVLGNCIGTNRTGTGDLGNEHWGINLSAAPGSEVTGNVFGGDRAGAANIIAFNGADTDDGVMISNANTTDNRILGNSIYSNADLGIDLAIDGATPNDAGDTDTGPNGLQNKPIVTDASTVGTTTTISGTLNSLPNATFTLRFFSSPPGGEEGQQFLDTLEVATDASGNAGFTFVPGENVSIGRTVTATATGQEGTSEFSAPGTVDAVIGP